MLQEDAAGCGRLKLEGGRGLEQRKVGLGTGSGGCL